MTRTFTGRHMAAILVAFFGVVIAVNFTMARFASATFGGVVVENSYVASQHFNRWLDEAEAERALGWDAVAAWRPDGRLAVTLRGAPPDAEVAATARHPLGRAADRDFTFEPAGDLRFVSRETLPEGRWLLRFEVKAGGRVWRREEELR
jgi:nitrogen fixation protein FixH